MSAFGTDGTDDALLCRWSGFLKSGYPDPKYYWALDEDETCHEYMDEDTKTSAPDRTFHALGQAECGSNEGCQTCRPVSDAFGAYLPSVGWKTGYYGLVTRGYRSRIRMLGRRCWLYVADMEVVIDLFDTLGE